MFRRIFFPVLTTLLLAAMLLGFFSTGSPGRPMAALTEQERTWLDQHKDDIVLTFDANFPPLEFQNSNENYTGISSEIVSMIEKRLGVSFQKRPSPDWNALISSLQSGETHICAGIVQTPERERFADFTKPYTKLPLVIITTIRAFPVGTTWKDLEGKRVGVVSGYASESFIRERAGDRFQIVPLRNVQEGLRDVSFGVIDAFVDNLATSSYIIERDGLTNLHVASATDFSFPMSIGVNKSYPLLFSAVQKALADIPVEEIDAVRSRWISLTGEGVWSREKMLLLKFSALFTLLLLIGLATISYVLKRRLNERVLKLKSAQQDLLDQTERLSLATEASNIGIWDYYPNTDQAFFNEKWFTMLGYEQGAIEATLTGWKRLVHPEDQNTFQQALADCIASGGTGLLEVECRLRQADASYRWVLCKGRVVSRDQNGNAERLIGLNLDFQKLKDAQAQVRRKEALAKAAFDQTFQFCGLLDLEGNMLNVNQRALVFVGAAEKDVLGRPFWDCPWWPDHEEAEALLRQDMSIAIQGGVARREVTNLDAQGKSYILDFSLSPLVEFDGSVTQFIVEGRDVTENKLFEAQLKEHVETLEKLFNDSPDPTLIIYNGHYIDCNKAALSILGYDKKEDLLNIRPADISPEHQEDGELSLSKVERMMSIAKKDGTLRFEWIHRRKDASTFYAEVTLSPVHISGKEVLYTIWRDISEQKSALHALQASEEKYRAIFNSAPIGIFRSDFGGELLDANPALAHMHGYSTPNEFLAGARNLRMDMYTSQNDFHRLQNALLANPSGVRMETAFCHHDGSDFPTIINAILHLDENGNASFIDGTIENITERQQAQQALREKTAMLEAQVNASIDGILVVDQNHKRVLINRRMGELFQASNDLLQNDDDTVLLSYVVGLIKYPEKFLAQVNYLYDHPDEISRDEIELKNGMLLDRYSAPVIGQDGKHYGRIWTFRDITERKALEWRLANQLAFQEALLDTIPYPVFYKGVDARFVGFNKAYEDFFGIKREDLIGKHVFDLDFLSPEDRQAYQIEDEAIIANVNKVHRELVFSRADGASRQTLYSVAGFRLADGSSGGLIGIIVDITELKHAEESLHQSEEKFSRIFEMAPECITFIRLRDFTIITANAAFETITGHTRDEAIGRSSVDLGLWDDPTLREEFLRKLTTQGHVTDIEFDLLRKDGTIRRVVNSAQLVVLAEEPCYVSIIHDITDVRKMQELLIQSEKMMSIGGLAAGIAHELNNPLGIVHQAVQNIVIRTDPDHKKNIEAAYSIGLDMSLLQQYIQARKIDVFMQDIKDAVQRASGIIRNMLYFSRRPASKRQVCDVRTIIDQAIFLASSDYDLKKSYDFKRIEIIRDLDADLPSCNCTDTEIEQVILNILRNAAQAMAMATPPTTHPKIEIRLRAVDANVRIEISDNGPGIDQEVQRKVFDPFFTTKPPGVGTGLGLSVSYFIITKGHGGKMWLNSTPGQGSTFVIELPADQKEALNA